MTARLILLSHAETAAVRSVSFADDEALTAQGRDDARRLRALLPRMTVSWRSPAVAADETAALLGVDSVPDPHLADLDCATWRGRRLSDVAAEDPAGLAAWRADPLYAGHGGISIEALLKRVSQWLDERRNDQGRCLAITHAAVIRCAILSILGSPSSGFWHINIPPLCRVELGTDGRRWVLRQILPQR